MKNGPKKLLIVVGARPNFVKVARFGRLASVRGGLQVRLVHTGQQSDHRMTNVFLDQFGLRPDHQLAIPAGGQVGQLAAIIRGLEPVLADEDPAAVMVVGDVTSTLGGALAANKMGFPVIHLESGLRSRDRGMPEEMNRLLCDRVADHFFTTEPSGSDNLLSEGASPDTIHFVGNTMIDTMVEYDHRIRENDILERMDLGPGGHVLLTMHRPATVDHPGSAALMVSIVERIASRCRTVFPLHPRTAANLEAHGLLSRLKTAQGLILVPPLDYFAFQRLLATSAMVVTDSGGVQEEATFRRIPCFTLRENTERPITVTQGSNELLPLDVDRVMTRVEEVLAGKGKMGAVPHLWDGHATERVLDILEHVL